MYLLVKDSWYISKCYVTCLWGFHKESKEDDKEKLQHCAKSTTLCKTEKEVNTVLLILLYLLIAHNFPTLKYVYISLSIVFTTVFPVPSIHSCAQCLTLVGMLYKSVEWMNGNRHVFKLNQTSPFYFNFKFSQWFSEKKKIP